MTENDRHHFIARWLEQEGDILEGVSTEAADACTAPLPPLIPWTPTPDEVDGYFQIALCSGACPPFLSCPTRPPVLAIVWVGAAVPCPTGLRLPCDVEVSTFARETGRLGYWRLMNGRGTRVFAQGPIQPGTTVGVIGRVMTVQEVDVRAGMTAIHLDAFVLMFGQDIVPEP